MSRNPIRSTQARLVGLSRSLLLACVGVTCANAQAPGSAFGNHRNLQPAIQQPVSAMQSQPASVATQPPVSAVNRGGLGAQPMQGSVTAPQAISSTGGSTARSSALLTARSTSSSNTSPLISPSNLLHNHNSARAAHGVMANDKLVSYRPTHNQIVRAQLTLLADENAIAQSVRRKSAVGSQFSEVAPIVAENVNVRDRGAQLQPSFSTGVSVRAPSTTSHVNAVLNAPDGIYYVNRKDRNFLITPGGYLTIQGKGFGDTVGEVNVFGRTSLGKLALQVIDWHDDEIYALLPPGLRGMPDQKAKLQVITRAGKPYLLDEGNFFAAREEVLLTNQLQRVFRLEESANWPISNGHDDGSIYREENGGLGGSGIDCKKPGTDRIIFLPLPNGFEVTGVVMTHGRTDAGDGDEFGNSGGRVFFPGYSLGEWRDESVALDRLRSTTQSVLYVNWGVWRNHTSQTLGSGLFDECESSYVLAVSVVGPAGVTPL